MNQTEKTYSAALGKLYNLSGFDWRDRAGISLIMPYRMEKRSGWWFFVCQLITNRHLSYSADSHAIACKHFLRNAKLANES